ncbi:MAG: DUF3501 family protein [Acidimicrobiales bacterium]
MRVPLERITGAGSQSGSVVLRVGVLRVGVREPGQPSKQAQVGGSAGERSDRVHELVLSDIWDLREYERRRDQYRSWIIERKRSRRVAVGDFVTLVFENRDTVRFQIQEMVRAERMISDEQVQGELDIYNALIPAAGELSATLFLELVEEEALRDWLPKLAGIERSIELHLGGEDGNARVIPCFPEKAHEAMLTREDVTSTVHYIRFKLDEDDVELLRSGEGELVANHPYYKASSALSRQVVDGLLADLAG